MVKDILERVVWTFAQAFASAIVGAEVLLFASDGTLDLSAVESAAIAGFAAVLALIKGAVATKVGGRNAALPG